MGESRVHRFSLARVALILVGQVGPRKFYSGKLTERVTLLLLLLKSLRGPELSEGILN